MRWLAPLTTVACLLLATVTMTAGAASTEPADIPACEELLTVRQARVAMHEPTAFILSRQVEGSVRACYYAGGSPGSKKVGHSIGVNWGPYAEFRKWFGKGELTEAMCDASADACKAIKDAAKQRSNLKSLGAVVKVLGRVGTVRNLRGLAFKGSPPAFVWLPSDDLAPLDELAWVLAYDVRSAHLLGVSCTSISHKAPDAKCAITAARQVFANIT